VTIPTWAIALILTPLVAALAYFIRMTTFDAIQQLRKSAEKQGGRLGRLEKAVAVLIAQAETREEDAAAPRARRRTLHELKSILERGEEDETTK